MTDRQTSTPSEDQFEELYPIRTVSSLTGVNPITLRAWERRYGLIKPQRTESGHRLYSRSNIEVINRAVELQNQGMSIGRIAQVLRRHLAEERVRARITDKVWDSYRQEMLTAIDNFSEARLDLIYENVLGVHSIQKVIHKLIVPVLADLGRRWKDGEGSIAEEHFFGVYLRNKLGALFHHRARLTQGQRLLGACVPGELHEVGLLLFALAAHDAGYRPILLGANMPMSRLPLAAMKAECTAIVLSAPCDADAEVLQTELPALTARTDIPVFIGGAETAAGSAVIEKAGAISLGSDIAAGLQRLRRYIGDPLAQPPARRPQ